MTTNTTAGRYKVVTATGESRPMTKAAANRVAKALRAGRVGRSSGFAKVEAKVVPVDGCRDTDALIMGRAGEVDPRGARCLDYVPNSWGFCSVEAA